MCVWEVGTVGLCWRRCLVGFICHDCKLPAFLPSGVLFSLRAGYVTERIDNFFIAVFPA